nr:EMILIN-3 [Nothobranchius furzeri]XP_054602098.1 EMILIN-3 [Nothobranchius furzeri]
MRSVVALSLFLLLVEAKYYNSLQGHQYSSGVSLSPHHEKPTSRHKNHCAYIVEKTVSLAVQDGAAPYVKAEYNKCSWGQKCPALMYRLLYKPVYKVEHRTVTELEWRCCPGFSGYNCMEGHQVYQHPESMMPLFKGPPMKGPQFKGPQHKEPIFKRPMFKAPPVKANPWSQANGPPTGSFNSYPLPHFGPPMFSSYPGSSFEPYPSEPEAVPGLTDTNSEPEHEQIQEPEEIIPEEIPAPPSGGEQPAGETTDQVLNTELEERLYGMEEDIRRLSQGLETLRGTVTGLEDSLRASLREDANRMLSALLSDAPGPIPAPATAARPSTVGFVEIPGGHLDTEGLDGSQVFPGLTELTRKVEGLRTKLQDKTAELQELKVTVMRHDGALKKISNGAGLPSDSSSVEGIVEKWMDERLSAARVEILGGFEKRVEGAERRCEEKAGNEHHQCQKEILQQQENMREALEESSSKLRNELGNLLVRIHSLEPPEECCDRTGGLVERVQQLETSVANLNQSQGHLRVELGGHKDHIEGMLEGRLGYVEAKLNLTGKIKSERRNGAPGQGLEARMEGKMKALEGRLLSALEELGNATAPALLEGHAVPALETELESLRGRLELDMDRVQKHLNSLEILCSSSCSSTQECASQKDSPVEGQELDQNVKEVLGMQGDHLKRLNTTLENVLRNLILTEKQAQAGGESGIQEELMGLRFNVSSVNQTLRSLQDSLDSVVHQVGEANSSWHDREVRLAHQIKGVVQLVGHQASMLGAGERRLVRLRSELQELKRRLTEEVRGCRSTAMGVKQEVTEVGGRVASVEDQCKGLNYLAEDLERIREELEKPSNNLLLKINGTLSSHAQQLSELKGELRNCSSKETPTQSSAAARGDTFTLT